LKNVQVTAVLHGRALCQEANCSFSNQKPNAHLKVVSVGFVADKVELGLYFRLVAYYGFLSAVFFPPSTSYIINAIVSDTDNDANKPKTEKTGFIASHVFLNEVVA
jgi:hypothetical protein